MKSYYLKEVNDLILRKQFLTDDSHINDIIKIAEDLCGLHRTDPITPYLILFNRMHDFTKIEFENELYLKKKLGKIRCMRRTLFIQTKYMMPIAFGATYKLYEKRMKGFLRYRNITQEYYDKCSNLIMNLLKEKELSTLEIKKALHKEINTDFASIITLMCDRGLLIRGRPLKSWKDRRYRYALFNEYFPEVDLNQYDEEEAIELLIKQYFKTYAPVTEEDIAWWSGLNKTTVREVLKEIQDHIIPVNISGLKKEYIMTKKDQEKIDENFAEEQDVINILPLFDPFIMGYKDRERFLNEKHYEYIFDRAGNATSSILFNGKIIGVWDVSNKPDPLVKLFLFNSVDKKVMTKIRLKAQKIGEFIFDQKVKLKECKSMVILTKRKLGGFITPLKDC